MNSSQGNDNTSDGLRLYLPSELLRPLIRQVVEEVIAALEQFRAQGGDKIAYSEVEAATLLSLRPHQLRDERRRVSYSRKHLPL
jgi:hypothetical protein